MCGPLLQSFFRLPWLGTTQGWASSCSAAHSTVLGTDSWHLAFPVDLRLACPDTEAFMLTDLNCQPVGDSILDSNLQCAYLGGPWEDWACVQDPWLDWYLWTAAWVWEPPGCLRLRLFLLCVWACAIKTGRERAGRVPRALPAVGAERDPQDPGL